MRAFSDIAIDGVRVPAQTKNNFVDREAGSPQSDTGCDANGMRDEPRNMYARDMRWIGICCYDSRAKQLRNVV